MMLCIVALLLLIITIVIYYIYYNKNKEHFQTKDKSSEFIRLINDEYSKGIDYANRIEEGKKNNYNLITDIDGGYARLIDPYNVFETSVRMNGYPKIPIVGPFNNTDYLKLENIARQECAIQNNCKAYSIGHNSEKQQYIYSLFNTDDLSKIKPMAQSDRNQWKNNFKTVLRTSPLTSYNKLVEDAKKRYQDAVNESGNGLKIFTKNYEIYENKIPRTFGSNIIKFGRPIKDERFINSYKYELERKSTLIEALNQCNKNKRCKGIIIISEKSESNGIARHYFYQLSINNTDNLLDIPPNFNGNITYLSRTKILVDTTSSTFGGSYISDMTNTDTTKERTDAPFNNRFKFDIYKNADTLRPKVKDVIVSKGEPFNQSKYNSMLEEAQKACILDINCSAFVAAYDISNSTLFYSLKKDDTEDSDNNNQFEFDNNTLNKYNGVVTYVKVRYTPPLKMPPTPVDKLCADMNYYNHISTYCVDEQQVPTVGENKICGLQVPYIHEASMCGNLTSVTSEDEDGRFYLDDKIATINNAFNKIKGLSPSLKTQKYNNNIELFKRLLIDIWNNSINVFFADSLNVGVGNTAGYATIPTDGSTDGFNALVAQNNPDTKLGILLENLYENCQYAEYNNYGYCDKSKFYDDLQKLYATSRILELGLP